MNRALLIISLLNAGIACLNFVIGRHEVAIFGMLVAIYILQYSQSEPTPQRAMKENQP